MADFVTSHRLTHKASLKMIEACVAKAEALGCKVSLAVVDQSCRLTAFLMMDGARHFSIITTQRKAITAASQRLPTGYAPEENALSMSVRMGDFTNVPGGFPIEVNGEVIGAVAAGGASRAGCRSSESGAGGARIVGWVGRGAVTCSIAQPASRRAPHALP
jgi:glc operon protein GlcG